MKRHISNILSLLSLLLCLSIIVLWYRSYGGYDTPVHWNLGGSPPNRGTDHQLVSSDGRMIYRVSWNSPRFTRASLAAPPTILTRLGFASQLTQSSNLGNQFPGEPVTVYVHKSYLSPHWFWSACFAIAPACWLVAVSRRGRQRGLGMCGKCGYDLRASKERCPECGTPSPVQPAGEPRQAYRKTIGKQAIG